MAPANHHERTLGFAGICHASGDLSGVMFNYRTSACIAWQGDMRPQRAASLPLMIMLIPPARPSLRPMGVHVPQVATTVGTKITENRPN